MIPELSNGIRASSFMRVDDDLIPEIINSLVLTVNRSISWIKGFPCDSSTQEHELPSILATSKELSTMIASLSYD